MNSNATGTAAAVANQAVPKAGNTSAAFLSYRSSCAQSRHTVFTSCSNLHAHLAQHLNAVCCKTFSLCLSLWLAAIFTATVTSLSQLHLCITSQLVNYMIFHHDKTVAALSCVCPRSRHVNKLVSYQLEGRLNSFPQRYLVLSDAFSVQF